MNQPQLFSNPEFGNIRVVEINGEPQFCLSDVCHAHTYWTQKGRLGLYELLKRNGYLPTIELAA